MSVQSPWAQSMLHEPPVHCVAQSPSAHVSAQAAPVQVWTQSPSGQLSSQVDPAAHVYWQSTLFGHVSVHDAPAAHTHALLLSQVKPARGGDTPASFMGSLAVVVGLPPPQATVERARNKPNEARGKLAMRHP